MSTRIAVVKSKTELERLFKLDIVEKSKTEMEILFHFVNKDLNPLKSAEIKRFVMAVDSKSSMFLQILEVEVACNSRYYDKVKKYEKERNESKAGSK